MKLTYNVLFVLALLMLPAVSAEPLTAVSQMGYHPFSHKQVVAYTNSQEGTFEVIDVSSSLSVMDGVLKKAVNYQGEKVECQGNNPCLIGDFSSLTTPGKYRVKTIIGGEESFSAEFEIKDTIFNDNIDLFMDFFDALKQTDSSFHADFNKAQTPPFPMMADGSFIMKTDQAALTLIRLGSAYNRNPELFDERMYLIIEDYVRYLTSLQGIEIEERKDGVGVRISHSVQPVSAFVPGPTDVTEVDVYIPGTNKRLATLPVYSLCSDLQGDDQEQCLTEAETFYKCQADEICLDMEYREKTGVITQSGGYDVVNGWHYEFGCYLDVNVNEEMFNEKVNPCLIFDSETDPYNTVITLLAYLKAYPALKDSDEAFANTILQQAIETESYISQKLQLDQSEKAFHGAALFLLYDFTQDEDYLIKAYNLRTEISNIFIGDSTRGNEFYWEEYALHRKSIAENGMEYTINSQNPEDFFVGKMFFDYKDKGPTAVSNNAERVYQFDPNIQFQNSRFMLTEGVLALKALTLANSAPLLVQEIADNQISWLTGQNAVQQGMDMHAPVTSLSFIFGIGNFPEEFHSRYLINTGYRTKSSNQVIGARGTNLQFYDEDSGKYVYFDGRFKILNNTLGALGNQWNGEAYTEPYQKKIVFSNGLTYIPGWINGAFDVNTNPSEKDVIFNYYDDIRTYQFTETTNEIVATAVEYFALADAYYNDKQRHPAFAATQSAVNTTSRNLIVNETDDPLNESIDNEITDNDTQQTNGTFFITTDPKNSTILLNGESHGVSSLEEGIFSFNVTPGNYSISVEKENYEPEQWNGSIAAEEQINLTFQLLLLNDSSNENEGNVSQPVSDPQNVNESDNQSAILSSEISITKNAEGEYIINELESIEFFVQTSGNTSIHWIVDNETIETTNSTEHRFTWASGILYTDSLQKATIIARSPTEDVLWEVNVENVINPFFTGDFGSSTAVLHIYTNNKFVNFTNLTVTLEDKDGTENYSLASSPANTNETDWNINLNNLAEGNTYLKEIIGYDSLSDKVLSFELDTERAHHRSIQSTQHQDNDNSGSSTSSSSTKKIKPEFELVYALFAKDVVGQDESQILTLDAKNFKGGIENVTATVISPEKKNITIPLKKTNGSTEYGTWQGELKNFKEGLYKLHSVTLSNKNYQKDIVTEGINFYATALSPEKASLRLVNTFFNATEIEANSSIGLSLDVQDSLGIKSVNVTIESNRGENKIVPAVLTEGTEKYGTWKAEIFPQDTDATYTITSVIVSNGKEQNTYPVENRQFYVKPGPSRPFLSDLSDGNIFADLLDPDGSLNKKKLFSLMQQYPWMPTLAGLMVVIILGTGFFAVSKIRTFTSKR